jgi:mannose-1-phosphate guanylyltransferase/mannose-6-phosphate isomerase
VAWAPGRSSSAFEVTTVVPVVLSGGAGTRLWPVSRRDYPKQLAPLLGKDSLLQQTVLRLDSVPAFGAPIVVCNEAHRFLIAEQLHAVDRPPAAMILEPVGRNTAPAIGVAALAALEGGLPADQVVLAVFPADHCFTDQEAWASAMSVALETAATGRPVTFGITPDRPETGYGYVRCRAADAPVLDALAFVEKPDAATAQRYLDEGGYYWNSGMFVFRADWLLAALGQQVPAILDAVRAAWDGRREDLDFVRLDADAFERSPSDSIDYAVMEHADGVACVPMAAGWSDVGAWDALSALLPADARGNVAVGDATLLDCDGVTVHAGSRLVTAVGLRDTVVVETPDAVMVAPRDRAQEVKRLVAALAEQGRDEVVAHQRIYRPWGYYETRADGARYQVKRILVKPGRRLSLQLHHHRSEHWVVVTGTARVTVGEQDRILAENESVYIPLGERHRLENPGKIDLELIEVQSGPYLGEDDIVRLHDEYGRDRADPGGSL